MINIQSGIDCQEGKELINIVFSTARKKKVINYKYRAENSNLFFCVAEDLKEARKQRDLWLQGIN